MTRLETLYEVMMTKGIITSKKEFAKKFGFAYANLARYLNGQLKTTIDSNNYRNFADAGVNIDWLLTGEGEMFRADTTSAEADANESLPPDVSSTGEGIPFYDIDVMAHISEALDMADERAAGVMVVPGFRDCFACFPVYGDSMKPKISSGDIIAVSQPVPMDRILWGEIYLVVTDCWRVVKTVHPGVTEEYIVLRSINPEYTGDTPVRRDDVYALYLVRGVVSRMGM